MFYAISLQSLDDLLNKSDEKTQPDDPSINLNKNDLFPELEIFDNACSTKQANKDKTFLDLLDDTVSNNPVFDTLDQPNESLRGSPVSHEPSSSNSGIETLKNQTSEVGESAVPTRHTCSLCGKYFTLKSSLQMHLKKCPQNTSTPSNINQETPRQNVTLPQEGMPLAFSTVSPLPLSTQSINLQPTLTLLPTYPSINTLPLSTQMPSQTQPGNLVLIPISQTPLATIAPKTQTDAKAQEQAKWPMFYTCKLCNRSFRLETRYKRHMAACKKSKVKNKQPAHTIPTKPPDTASSPVATDPSMIGGGATAQPEFECEFCDKKFRFFSLLRKHILASRVRQCEWCHKSFHIKSKDFESHLLECAEPCETCGKKETTRAKLQKHMERSHYHKCHHCKRFFANVTELQAHRCDKIPICPLCGNTFRDRYTLDRHIAHCGLKSSTYNCQTCNRVLYSAKSLKKHEQACAKQRYRCRVCKGLFQTKQKRDSHEKVCGTYDRKWSVIDSFKCSICQQKFADKHLLIYHKKSQHNTNQSGSGEPHDNALPLQDMPFPPDRAPWVNPDGTHDESVKTVYEGEKDNILAPSLTNTFPRIYNLPLNDSVSLDTIIDFINQIRSSENHHFKLNLDFGLLLDDLERDRVRYFRPLASHGLLNRPFRIGGRATDIERLRKYLEKMDLIGKVMQRRENSRFKFRYFTNLQVIVYPTNHLLGHGQSPHFIRNCKYIKILDRDTAGNFYDDNLCIFRCLVYHFQGLSHMNKNVDIYFHQWRTFLGNVHLKKENYMGLSTTEIPHFEECFKVNVSLYSMNEQGVVIPVYRSTRSFENTLYLNQYDNHLSVITDFRYYGKTFECHTCGLLFNRIGNCERHEKACKQRTKYMYPGGYHKGNLNIFEEGETLDIQIPADLRKSEYAAVFDFESLMNEKTTSQDDNTHYIAEHQPISFSVTSNVDGFTTPYSVVNENPSALIQDMHGYLKRIAVKAETLMRQKWHAIFSRIEFLLALWKPQDMTDDDDDDIYAFDTDDEMTDSINPIDPSRIPSISDEAKKKMYRKIQRFSRKFTAYARQLTVIGFNSSSYDCPLIMKEMVAHFGLHDKTTDIIKQGKKYSNIKTEHFNFVDLLMYLPPNTSYSSFLRTFRIEERKLFFPYEWLNNTQKLDHPSLPPVDQWFSTISGKNVLDDGIRSIEENYTDMKTIWQEKNMRTMREWLVHYNESDVIGFLEGVKKMMDFYFDMDIDIFKSCISIPSVARRLLFETAKKEGAHFSLIDTKNKDLFDLIKSNLTGGLSAVFHRHQKAGETFVDKKKENICKQILGLDANS